MAKNPLFDEAKLRAAANDLIRAIRTDNVEHEDGRIDMGKCRLCEAPNGIKHAPSCPSWPFILERTNL